MISLITAFDHYMANKKEFTEETLREIQGYQEKAKVALDDGTGRLVSTYSELTKDRVIQVYLITGSVAKTAEITKVPLRTIHGWRTQKWWEIKFEEAKERYRKTLDGKFSAMFGYIAKELETRLRKGDEVVLKDGTKVYKKIPARELASIADHLWKILALIRGEPTSRSEKITTTEYLDKLQEDLEKRTKKKKQEETNERLH